ncbi:unnamed protein product [Hermetia illucens]|uniref:TIL domain-containing protein n=1 Tax=Hermetia illucens TaxID=343691 RepID=A0A7R8UUE8_HERIL|nr:unnamed protein product [Hermetia illucens]
MLSIIKSKWYPVTMKLLAAFAFLLIAAIMTLSHSASVPDEVCGENEVFKTCGRIGCHPSCDMVLHGSQCIGFSLRCGVGCYCKDGYARANGEKCVNIADCPKYVNQPAEDSSN